jgi:hypothetical protein
MRIGSSPLFMIICPDRGLTPTPASWRHPPCILELLVNNAHAPELSSGPGSPLQLVIAKQEDRHRVPKTKRADFRRRNMLSDTADDRLSSCLVALNGQ